MEKAASGLKWYPNSWWSFFFTFTLCMTGRSCRFFLSTGYWVHWYRYRLPIDGQLGLLYSTGRVKWSCLHCCCSGWSDGSPSALTRRPTRHPTSLKVLWSASSPSFATDVASLRTWKLMGILFGLWSTLIIEPLISLEIWIMLVHGDGKGAPIRIPGISSTLATYCQRFHGAIPFTHQVPVSMPWQV